MVIARRPALRLAIALALLLPAGAHAVAQQLGHKLLGTIGVDAGVQESPGFYLADRLVHYHATKLIDRNGNVVPIPGFDLSAVANAVGASLTLKGPGTPYASFAAGIPWAHLRVTSDDPRVGTDKLGLGDLYVQPLRLGWRWRHADLVTSYAFYAPTGRFEPRGGSVGRGSWTHEFSLGGAVFFDPRRRHRASVLASYDINTRKRSIDIRRGSTIQFQGGAGITLLDFLRPGIAGFALWQVTDDSGIDVPPPLRGARDRVFGLGPEIGVIVPAIRLQGFVRTEWDLGVRSRSQGRILVGGLTWAAWMPQRQSAGAGGYR